MSVAFSQFCSATPAVREALRRRVDDLGRQGRSCEFADCRMPAGCVPRQAALGFLHREGRYLLYWRPAVAYRGQSPALSALFARSAWRFDSYEAMTDRLASLRREAEDPGPRPFRPPALEAEPPASPWPPLYRRLREELGKQVLGQDRALEAAAFRLYSHVGKRDPARPLSLVLHGPTGVGKSELGKALAPALERCCGQPWQRVWTELNTFTEAHTVHRLTGAPPGYVGYEDQPVFEAVRRNPRTVFMFDELEKAHPEVLKVFMSILDEGRCTARKADETGNRELDFRRCVFVFTTNADLTAAGGRPLGFSDDRPASRREAEAPGEAPSPAALAERLFRENEEARRAMVRLGVLREIAGRFSGIIGFQALDGEARRAVTVKQIRALGREYGLDIVQVDPDTARALTPGRDALSVRSSACVLESLLAPLLTAAGGRTACRLAGLPGGLRLLPAYSQDSSTTALAASSS
ncbi:AAA family ATPase [uncultured Oscillibacter sp.]|uniref:ATP-dependent Clp protease ATP-binding subunit n=1 Tax=uncultured Oscillibacter sp. TaxID=876091 RepID=UPI00261FF034|nr:AAA family ATPase [uncultured Oscillibacter sp.]